MSQLDTLEAAWHVQGKTWSIMEYFFVVKRDVGG